MIFEFRKCEIDEISQFTTYCFTIKMLVITADIVVWISLLLHIKNRVLLYWMFLKSTDVKVSTRYSPPNHIPYIKLTCRIAYYHEFVIRIQRITDHAKKNSPVTRTSLEPSFTVWDYREIYRCNDTYTLLTPYPHLLYRTFLSHNLWIRIPYYDTPNNKSCKKKKKYWQLGFR